MWTYPGMAVGNQTSLTVQTFTLNATNLYYAFPLIFSSDKTIDHIDLIAYKNAGTLADTDFVVELWNATALNVPNAIVGAYTTNTMSPATSTWGVGISSKSTNTLSWNLSANTLYFLVIRNANATPNTNNPKMMLPPGGKMIQFYPTYTSTNGTTWTTASTFTLCPGYIIFSDGSDYGFQVIGNPISSTYAMYGTREVGAKFSIPNGIKLNFDSINFNVRENGTLVTEIVANIYNDTQLIATSVPSFNLSGIALNGNYWFIFNNEITLYPGKQYRATLKTKDAIGDTSNYYYIIGLQYQNAAQWAKNADFFGTSLLTYYNGSTWTDASATEAAFTLRIQEQNGLSQLNTYAY